MKETIETAEKNKRAFLVGIKDGKMSGTEADSLIRELESLVYSLGLEIAGLEMVRVRENHAKYGVGTGKAEELAQKAMSVEADCIIFDREISASQQRNWEELVEISVFDRQELIIRIFAGRARTREAELQVRLAELAYALPRLSISISIFQGKGAAATEPAVRAKPVLRPTGAWWNSGFTRWKKNWKR